MVSQSGKDSFTVKTKFKTYLLSYELLFPVEDVT
jgi:hypothetical protein